MKRKTYRRIRWAFNIAVLILPFLPIIDFASWHSGIFYDDGIRGNNASPWWMIFGIFFIFFILINWAAMTRNHAQEASGKIVIAYMSCIFAILVLGMMFALSHSFQLQMSAIWSEISSHPETPKIDPFAKSQFWWGAWFLFMGYGLKSYWDEAVKSFAEWHLRHILPQTEKSSACILREIRDNPKNNTLEYIDWSYDDNPQSMTIVSAEILLGQENIARDYLSQIFGESMANQRKVGPAGGLLLYENARVEATIAEIFDALCDLQDDECELVISARVPSGNGELILFDSRNGNMPDPERLTS